MKPIDELSELIENYGWDPELIDLVKARMAQLEKVAELADRAHLSIGDPALFVELRSALDELDRQGPS